MPINRRKKLKMLARMMNSRNISPVPVTDALIDCFELVINPEENEFLLNMGTEPRSLDFLKSLCVKTDYEFNNFLNSLLKKGVAHTNIDADGAKHYILTPILVGWFEIYLSDGKESQEKREFAKSVEKYFKFFGKLNFAPLRNIANIYLKRKSKPNKTIAVIDSKKIKRIEINEKIKSGPSSIMPARSVEELIIKYGDSGKIALMHCFCRQWHKMTGSGCRFGMPGESCLAIGDITVYITDNKIGRFISTGEALELVHELQKKGAIHTVFYDMEDIGKPEIGICSCCWDCCGVHGSYNRGRTHLNVLSYYLAEINDPGSCTLCGRCRHYCPTQAVALTGDKPSIDSSLCIGCGQCSYQCPADVFVMTPDKRHALLPFRKKSGTRLG